MATACNANPTEESVSFKADAMKNIMNGAHARHCRSFTITVAFALVMAAPILAQNSSSQRAGIPEDWTHHHAVFADAGTAEQAMRNRTYDRWLEMVNDPRYQLQRAKNIAAGRAKTATFQEDDFSANRDAKAGDALADGHADTRIVSAAPVRFSRGLTKASVAHPPASGAYRDATQSPEFDIWSKLPPVRWRWHPNGAKVDWSETLGSGGGLGLGNYPAKYSFSTSTSSCTDWVAYGTGLAGGATQATIIAYTNLYSGTCSGSIPNVNWAFNTGTGSTVLTSPVLSLDGTQIAFVQNSATGVASLVVLKWSTSGTLTAPTTLSSQASGSAYRSCTAPCMFSVNFSGGASDSGSSAWYDYVLDTVWVGDDNGMLHKFTGVFAGTPAEVTTGWPVTVSASPLNGPVRDSATGNVFVGDYNLTTNSPCTPSASTSTAPCGFLYSFNSATGTLNAKSAQLDYNFGIVDSPLLDPFAGQLYVAVGSDGEIGTSTNCGTGTPCAGIFQLSTSFPSGASGTEATIGPGYDFLMIGAFDNSYLTSANASSPTGHMYVVGNTGPANNTLYQISITANVMSTTSTAGPVVAQNYTNGYYASGLSVTEFFNNGTDYIFLSTIAFSNYSGCGTTPSINIGCVVGFNVTSGSISALTLPTGSSPAAGGASGIIVDNAGSATGESNIYFSALSNQTCTTSGGSSGCAIQISQSAP
jgi:hypothetical protein